MNPAEVASVGRGEGGGGGTGGGGGGGGVSKREGGRHGERERVSHLFPRDFFFFFLPDGLFLPPNAKRPIFQAADEMVR